MDLNKVRQDTMAALGITDPNEVSYITQELLDDYQAGSLEVEKIAGISANECAAAGVAPLAGYGSYGNSLVFLPGQVKYKQGPRGTPNYGCGTDNWTWRADPGDTYTPQADCSGGRKQYLLFCPSCV